MEYDIAILPGDGIGPEIYEAIAPLFTDLAETHRIDLETT